VRAGKVRYIGFSNWSAWKVAAAMEIQKARGWAQFTHGQMYYSLLGRDVERDVLPMLRHFGLGMTVWSPLAYGFLSGAYTRESLAQPDNRFSNFDMLQFDKAKAFALLDCMRPIAAARGISVAQLALAWLLARPGVSSILLGATKMHQLDDNLAAADVTLSAEDLAALDTATAIEPLYPTSQWIEPDRKTARAIGHKVSGAIA
ncbi:MAG TPA: aldo/keto reductase, partial [Acetobacteraceae bacterium]|nr:aldo/keto reductase [Acetobacteraceae bacterium]